MRNESKFLFRLFVAKSNSKNVITEKKTEWKKYHSMKKFQTKMLSIYTFVSQDLEIFLGSK